MKNRLFVVIENLHNDAIFKQSLFDGKQGQIVTTGC